MARSTSRREAKPLFVGLEHALDSPDYRKTLALIEKNVKPGMRVGLELSRQRLDDAMKNQREYSNDFFVNIAGKIREKGGTIVPIDADNGRFHYLANIGLSMRFDPRRPHLSTKEERTAFNNVSKLILLRSKNMLRNALNHGTQINFVGAQHAYEINRFARHVPLSVQLLSKHPQLKYAYRVLPKKDLAELAARFKTIKPRK